MSLVASTETRGERIKICLECPFLKKGIVAKCSACGCPIRSKAALASSSCPKGKWGPEASQDK